MKNKTPVIACIVLVSMFMIAGCSSLRGNSVSPVAILPNTLSKIEMTRVPEIPTTHEEIEQDCIVKSMFSPEVCKQLFQDWTIVRLYAQEVAVTTESLQDDQDKDGFISIIEIFAGTDPFAYDEAKDTNILAVAQKSINESYTNAQQCLLGTVDTSNWEQLGCLQHIYTLKKHGVTWFEEYSFASQKTAETLMKVSTTGKEVTTTENIFKEYTGGIPTTIESSNDISELLMLSFERWQNIVQKFQDIHYLDTNFSFTKDDVHDISHVVLPGLRLALGQFSRIVPLTTILHELQTKFSTTNNPPLAATMLSAVIRYSSCVTGTDTTFCTGYETTHELLLGQFLSKEKYAYTTGIRLRLSAGTMKDPLNIDNYIFDSGAKINIEKLLLAEVAANPLKNIIITRTLEEGAMLFDLEVEHLLVNAAKNILSTEGVLTPDTLFQEYKLLASKRSLELGEDETLLSNLLDEFAFKTTLEKSASTIQHYAESLETSKIIFSEAVLHSLSPVCSIAQTQNIPFITHAYAASTCELSLGKSFLESWTGTPWPQAQEHMATLIWSGDEKNKVITFVNTSKKDLWINDQKSPQTPLRIQPEQFITKSFSDFITLTPCVDVHVCMDFSDIILHAYAEQFRTTTSPIGNISSNSPQITKMIRHYFEVSLFTTVEFLKNNAEMTDSFIHEVVQLLSQRNIVFTEKAFTLSEENNPSLTSNTTYIEFLQEIISTTLALAANAWKPLDASYFRNLLGESGGNAAFEGFVELSDTVLHSKYLLEKDKTITDSPNQQRSAENIYRMISQSSLGEPGANRMIAHFKVGNWDEFAKIIAYASNMDTESVWNDFLYKNFSNVLESKEQKNVHAGI